MRRHDVIVIGGSTGAGSALRRILAHLPPDLPAALFVVLHIGAEGVSELAENLGRICPLKVVIAADGQPIEQGVVHVAPAGRHLLLFEDVVRLGVGPRENMARPAVDPLFRSAALAYGGRVAGLILSGALNDGAAGLCAVKQRNGLALVQHPEDAEAPSMPQAALEACPVDETVRLADLAETVLRCAQQPAAPDAPASPDLELEVRIAMGSRLGSANLDQLAEPSPISCPHCHGVLSEVRGPGPLRFRCQTGHAFTAKAALAAHGGEVEEALMVSLRLMEERASLSARMARDARERGHPGLAESYGARAEEYAGYAATLREAAARSLRALDEGVE